MSNTETYEKIKKLIERKLPKEELEALQSGTKEPKRLETVVEIFQNKVSWDERILLPYGEHLFLVEKNGEYIIKCECGYEFGDFRMNWKLNSLIHCRKTEEEIKEVYDCPMHPEPRYSEIREFYCPNCKTQLWVEVVPPTYPIIFNFLPDIQAIYKNVEVEFSDNSHKLIETWIKEILKE